MDRLRFRLNGEWVDETGLSPTLTLLRYLREVRGLSGTKEGCAEGDCGACTVVVVERGLDGAPALRAVNACLLLLPMVQGKDVFTVEALKQDQEGPHPVQQAVVDALGSQCGYCTPGVVMSLLELAHRDDLDADWKVDDQLCGNLCRCTGYRPIRDAASKVAGRCREDRLAAAALAQGPSLSMALDYEARGQRFACPDTFERLWKTLDAQPDARLVAGGTDLSLGITKRHERPASLVSLEGLAELRRVDEGPAGYVFGATVTIAEFEALCEARLPALHRMLRYFGSRQIKHRATVGGNLCNASPVGDLAPALLALGAAVVLGSRTGERRVLLEDFFLGYRRTALRPAEILVALEVPRPELGARVAAYKVSKRREVDISAVSAGFLVETDAEGCVRRARLGYGGMAATPARALRTERALMGKPWTEATVEDALGWLRQDFTPLSDHRGSAEYRGLIAANLLRGFYLETREVHAPPLATRHTATVQATGGGPRE